MQIVGTDKLCTITLSDVSAQRSDLSVTDKPVTRILSSLQGAGAMVHIKFDLIVEDTLLNWTQKKNCYSSRIIDQV